jgi:phosphatidylglycerol:prolipoprotein diacylglycerol transferase
MVFPSGGISRGSPDWEPVKRWAESAGFDVSGTMLNLPRHPSQLYEALFEGIVLWLIIWLLKDRRPVKGFIISLYIGGYGFFRFFIEYFREPDAELGYRFQFAPNDLPLAVAHPLTSISTGQFFNVLMVLAAILWLLIAARLPNRAPVLRYADADAPPPPKTGEERRAERNSRRKQRKRLK